MPVRVTVAGANRNDQALASETVAGMPAACPLPPAAVDRGVGWDKGYACDAVCGVVRSHGSVPHRVPCDSEREWAATASPATVPAAGRWNARCAG